MIYTFGTFAFDDATLELTREGRRVAIEPQPARALARLLAARSELVTRDELRAAIWGADTHVDYDRGLAYCLGQMRAALGDSGDNPRFVQTLPKRGVRFVAPVSAAASTAPVSATPASTTPASTAPTSTAPASPEPVVASALPAAAARGGASTRRWLLATAAVGVAAIAGWRLRAAEDVPGTTVAVSIFDNETGDQIGRAHV